MKSYSPPANHRTQRFPCSQCGAELYYAPGTAMLRCEYCGYQNPIANADEAIVEKDFHETLRQLAETTPTVAELTNRCASCGADFTLAPDTHAGACPYCGSAVIAGTEHHRRIQASAVLPFRITREQAREAFQQWLNKLWFAPDRLKDFARSDTITGIYVPYWTYDAKTVSAYQGERGDYYQVPEIYETVENGKTVTRTRLVTRIRWTPAAGMVSRDFDDLLVLASSTLPRHITERLEPWDLDRLEPYRMEYLSGFRSEMYQLDPTRAFEQARDTMSAVIQADVARAIGGDRQRIARVETRYDDIRFKHILLPIWVSAFRYKDRPYRFVVNGCTGEVQGERPYSHWKIAAAILLGVALAGAAVLVFMAVPATPLSSFH